MPILAFCPECAPGTRPTLLTGGFCSWHSKHPTGVTYQHSVEPEKPYRIPKVSVKQGRENREYGKAASRFKKNNPVCQARLECCKGFTEETHHMAGRIGANMLDESLWLAVCRPCHEWIERFPLKAKAMGLSLRRVT